MTNKITKMVPWPQELQRQYANSPLRFLGFFGSSVGSSVGSGVAPACGFDLSDLVYAWAEREVGYSKPFIVADIQLGEAQEVILLASAYDDLHMVMNADPQRVWDTAFANEMHHSHKIEQAIWTANNAVRELLGARAKRVQGG